ncbi:acyltransferase family protein [Bosea sp. RCC_152_1]|uniref:acyltransferase family protein n=1 Tax=Bosea sp. RCC_152_1 TaxID=3239228 RepID=UPI003526616C
MLDVLAFDASVSISLASLEFSYLHELMSFGSITSSAASIDRVRAARNPGLDAVRTLAITLVLIAHFGEAAAWVSHVRLPKPISAAGYFGVEIFFALSGFLIGGILLRMLAEQPTASAWGVFMVRRWMRTLPVYFLWILVLCVVTPPPDGARIVWIYTALLPNLAWTMIGGTWFPVAWSLMVEEWFYLLFSASLLAIAAKRPRFAIPIILLLFLLSPLWATVWFRLTGTTPQGTWDEAVRKIVIIRLDAIAYGVAVAWLQAGFPALLKRLRWIMFSCGVSILLILWVNFFEDYEFTRWFRDSLYAPLTSLGCALCIPAAYHLNIKDSLIKSAVTWLSVRSYGLYIVHFSLIHLFGSTFYSQGWSLQAAVALSLIASLLIAEASWRWFEQPILRMRPRL